jgi:hypothetical protein
MENRGNREIFNHKEHKDHMEKLIFRPSLSAKALATADVFVLSVLYVVKSLSDLLVDRAGGARHTPGMAQKSPDEARRPPGTGPYVNQRLYESRKPNVEMWGRLYDPFKFYEIRFSSDRCATSPCQRVSLEL